MKQLFKKMVSSETGASIDRHGDLLVAKYKKHGRSKQVMAAEEIQALIDERDDALRKVTFLPFFKVFINYFTLYNEDRGSLMFKISLDTKFKSMYCIHYEKFICFIRALSPNLS